MRQVGKRHVIFPIRIFAVLLPLNLATAIATALPDLPSDARAEKRTLVVMHGLGPARRFILVLVAGALILHGLYAPLLMGVDAARSLWVLLLPAAAIGAAGLIHLRAEPGTRSLDVFLFLVILAHLAYVAGMVALVLGG